MTSKSNSDLSKFTKEQQELFRIANLLHAMEKADKQSSIPSFYSAPSQSSVWGVSSSGKSMVHAYFSTSGTIVRSVIG
jgi:hypothetical protein